MQPIDRDILDRTAEGLLDEIQTIPDIHMLSLELKREKQKEIIKAHLMRYADLVSDMKDTGDLINDIVASGWRTESFEIFWNAYGKKVQYAPCVKKWSKLKKQEIDAILAIVEDFVKATPEKQFRPNPLTFLNQRRWEDELPTRVESSRKVLPPEKENTWDGY